MAGLLDLVIVHDAHAARVAFVEDEEDAPRVVDPDAVGAGEVALQFLEVVAGAREIDELGGCGDLVELAPGDGPDVLGNGSGRLGVVALVNVPRGLVPVRGDHFR
jgi:hypothetical protein